MDGGVTTGDLLWEVWFAVIILTAGALFLAKLKFGPRFYQRQEKRWLHSYTARKLEPVDQEGRSRSVKVKDLDEEARAKSAAGASAESATTASSGAAKGTAAPGRKVPPPRPPR